MVWAPVLREQNSVWWRLNFSSSLDFIVRTVFLIAVVLSGAGELRSVCPKSLTCCCIKLKPLIIIRIDSAESLQRFSCKTQKPEAWLKVNRHISSQKLWNLDLKPNLPVDAAFACSLSTVNVLYNLRLLLYQLLRQWMDWCKPHVLYSSTVISVCQMTFE